MNDTVTAFLNTILPGDPGSAVPNGSSIDMTRETASGTERLAFSDLPDLLDAAAFDIGKNPFTALNGGQRMDAINLVIRKNRLGMTALIVHCLRCFYTAPEVLRALPAGAVPPFPAGNFLEEDDWSILEPVYERGPVFRSVEG